MGRVPHKDKTQKSTYEWEGFGGQEIGLSEALKMNLSGSDPT